MLIIWIVFGAVFLFYLQKWIYGHYWEKDLSAELSFSRESAVEGEVCQLSERVENGKLLPLPMLKVKFQVSRKLRFSDEGDGAVTDKYYRNDILSLGPRQRVIRTIPFVCGARGYFRLREMDLVAADLFLTREMISSATADSTLYVYPAPVSGVELDSALQKLNGEILAKRHMLEDPFEYRGIREYAPYDEMKTINWKATARTGDLMVNIRNYTSFRAVRIFLNLADTGILKNEQLVELCISIAARFAGELLEQGIRVAVYANGRDVLTGDPMKMQPSAGPGHMESINRAFSRISLEEGVYPFGELFRGELEEEGKDMATLFLSVDRSPEFQEDIRTFARMGTDFTWMCPLFPRMESHVEEEEALHFIRLDAEEMLNGK